MCVGVIKYAIIAGSEKQRFMCLNIAGIIYYSFHGEIGKGLKQGPDLKRLSR